MIFHLNTIFLKNNKQTNKQMISYSFSLILSVKLNHALALKKTIQNRSIVFSLCYKCVTFSSFFFFFSTALFLVKMYILKFQETLGHYVFIYLTLIL